MGIFEEIKTPAVKSCEPFKPPPPHGQPHSVALPGSKREGRSEVYRHWRFTDSLVETLTDEKTQHDFFEKSASLFPKARCFGWRPWNPKTKKFDAYVWQDYGTVAKRREDLGKGIVELLESVGIFGKQRPVGIWCSNRPEWQITDLGCMSQSLFSVSLYDTLGPDATEYIINHAGLPIVVASINHVPALLRLKPRCPTLKIIISVESLSDGEQPGASKADLLNNIAEDLDVKIVSFAQVEELGASTNRPMVPPHPDEKLTINYTSGTTGNPKGVVLTHGNSVAATFASILACQQNKDSCILSYLPLAHVYERVGQHAALAAGTRVGFYHGNVLEIVDDMKILKPTGFASVPRLYNRFGASIKAATTEAPGFRGTLSRHVVATKLDRLKDPDSPSATAQHALYDRIWGKKVVEAIGLEKANFLVSGSAPLDPTLHQFLRAVFGVHFLQGYGLTESYAASFNQLDGDLSVGNCGAPAPCIEACLVDLPDMDYLSTDKPNPRGELLMRGPAIFKEYYRNPEETKKAFTEDGWFRTGDVAEIDHLGRFKIIDRRKNVLKLAQGEYVSPERIENVYLAHCPWMAAAYVHGDSSQSSLVLIGAMMPEMFAAFASKVLGQTFSQSDVDTLKAAAINPKMRKAMMQELEKAGRQSQFQTWERVKNISLLYEPFTVENELLTPTLKLKRPQTARAYRDEITKLYEEALATDPKLGMKARL